MNMAIMYNNGMIMATMFRMFTWPSHGSSTSVALGEAAKARAHDALLESEALREELICKHYSLKFVCDVCDPARQLMLSFLEHVRNARHSQHCQHWISTWLFHHS